MRKKRYGVEQMIGVLKQTHVGVPVAEVIRKAGIGEQTFYRWKAKYAGLEVESAPEVSPLGGRLGPEGTTGYFDLSHFASS
jgi:putative transposase